MKKILRERRELLRTKFTKIQNRFTYVNHIESSDPEEIHLFFKESMEFGCEGIMIKVLDDSSKNLENKTRMNLLSSYEPGLYNIIVLLFKLLLIAFSII